MGAERLPASSGLPAQEGAGAGAIDARLPGSERAAGGAESPSGQDERPHGALPLRSGDRVIQTRNNYTLGVFNGDTGVVVAITPDEVRVDFGDGRDVVYARPTCLTWSMPYCPTVHRAQGSEWPGVVLWPRRPTGRRSREICSTLPSPARGAPP